MTAKKPLTCPPDKPATLLLFVGEKRFPFSPPLPYLPSSAPAVHLYYGTDSSCLSEQLFTRYYITSEANSLLPGTLFAPDYSSLCTCTILISI